MRKAFFTTVATNVMDGDEGEIMISTETPDRDRDVLLAAGMDASDYLANPTVLFQHGRDPARGALPIAATTALTVTPGIGIRARFRWLEGDEFVARVKAAFQQRVLNAASVAFLSITPVK